MPRKRDPVDDLLDDDVDPEDSDYAREMSLSQKVETVDGVEYPMHKTVKSSAWTEDDPKTYEIVIVDAELNGTCECVGYGYRGNCTHLKDVRLEMKSTEVDRSDS